MLRIRFKVPGDSMPAIWPVALPYWQTGWDNDDNAVVVAYVNEVDDLYKQWPDAIEVEPAQERDEVTFTDRFPKPDWFAPRTKGNR